MIMDYSCLKFDKMRLLVLIVCLLFFGACIGVDHLDDPIVGESIEITPNPIAVLVGKTEIAKVTFKDKYGIEQEANPIWTTTSPEIASVDSKGVVTGLKPGQTFLIASHSTVKDTTLVTVVGDALKVAKVEVIESVSRLSIGQTIALMAMVRNVNDQLIFGKTVVWKSSNELILFITSDGIATAKADGSASVIAEVDGVTSNPIKITVGNTIRTGTFVRSGGYEASGTCSLRLENNKLILNFESDFKTSFALGTYIYLSNTSTNAIVVKSKGLELGQITQNGAHSFSVTSLSSTVKLDDYKYVIILCKPATVLFGYAELR
jgi:hypothetical protein